MLDDEKTHGRKGTGLKANLSALFGKRTTSPTPKPPPVAVTPATPPSEPPSPHAQPFEPSLPLPAQFGLTRIQQLQKLFTGHVSLTLDPKGYPRTLIAEGFLKKIGKKNMTKRYYFILLNDTLVYAASTSKGFVLHQQVPLTDVKIIRSSRSEKLFHVQGGAKPFTCVTETRDEREDWVGSITSCLPQSNNQLIVFHGTLVKIHPSKGKETLKYFFFFWDGTLKWGDTEDTIRHTEMVKDILLHDTFLEKHEGLGAKVPLELRPRFLSVFTQKNERPLCLICPSKGPLTLIQTWWSTFPLNPIFFTSRVVAARKASGMAQALNAKRHSNQNLPPPGRAVVAPRVKTNDLLTSLMLGDFNGLILDSQTLLSQCPTNDLVTNLPVIACCLFETPLFLRAQAKVLIDCIKARAADSGPVAQAVYGLLSSSLFEGCWGFSDWLSELDRCGDIRILFGELTDPNFQIVGATIEVPDDLQVFHPFDGHRVRRLHVDNIFNTNAKPLLLSVHCSRDEDGVPPYRGMNHSLEPSQMESFEERSQSISLFPGKESIDKDDCLPPPLMHIDDDIHSVSPQNNSNDPNKLPPPGRGRAHSRRIEVIRPKDVPRSPATPGGDMHVEEEEGHLIFNRLRNYRSEDTEDDDSQHGGGTSRSRKNSGVVLSPSVPKARKDSVKLGVASPPPPPRRELGRRDSNKPTVSPPPRRDSKTISPPPRRDSKTVSPPPRRDSKTIFTIKRTVSPPSRPSSPTRSGSPPISPTTKALPDPKNKSVTPPQVASSGHHRAASPPPPPPPSSRPTSPVASPVIGSKTAPPATPPEAFALSPSRSSAAPSPPSSTSSSASAPASSSVGTGLANPSSVAVPHPPATFSFSVPTAPATITPTPTRTITPTTTTTPTRTTTSTTTISSTTTPMMTTAPTTTMTPTLPAATTTPTPTPTAVIESNPIAITTPVATITATAATTTPTTATTPTATTTTPTATTIAAATTTTVSATPTVTTAPTTPAAAAASEHQSQFATLTVSTTSTSPIIPIALVTPTRKRPPELPTRRMSTTLGTPPARPPPRTPPPRPCIVPSSQPPTLPTVNEVASAIAATPMEEKKATPTEEKKVPPPPPPIIPGVSLHEAVSSATQVGTIQPAAGVVHQPKPPPTKRPSQNNNTTTVLAATGERKLEVAVTAPTASDLTPDPVKPRHSVLENFLMKRAELHPDTLTPTKKIAVQPATPPHLSVEIVPMGGDDIRVAKLGALRPARRVTAFVVKLETAMPTVEKAQDGELATTEGSEDDGKAKPRSRRPSRNHRPRSVDSTMRRSRRTRSGHLSVDRSFTLDDLENSEQSVNSRSAKEKWPTFEAGKIIFKTGDDLRQDVACVHIFRMLNTVWRQNKVENRGLVAQARCYGVTAISPHMGCVQYVPDCKPLRHVKDMFGETGDSARFQHPDWEHRLIATGAGGYISAYVLGIRDRHHDNILVEPNGTLFHIDFGHILGESVTVDTASFAITPDLKQVMGDDYYNEFVNLCVEAFAAIRQNVELVISFCTMMLSSFIPKHQVVTFLRNSLMLSDDLGSACHKLRGKIEAAPRSFKTRTKNVLHAVATDVNFKDFLTLNVGSLSASPSPRVSFSEAPRPH